MNRILSLMLTSAFPLCALAAPQTYVLDPEHSFPNFIINHLGMSTIHGRFDRMTGKVVLDQPARSGSLEVKISTASVTTGAKARDDALRSASFFNSAEFPEIVYKSTRFNFNGDNLESIEGSLTISGVTKPVKLNVTLFKCGPHAFTKKPMCGADAETVIKRSDFGIKFGLPAIADELKLAIGVEAYPE
jgi:polyisoprenoid-binding protein YceI